MAETHTYTVEQFVGDEIVTTEVANVGSVQHDWQRAGYVNLLDGEGALLGSFLNAHRITRAPNEIEPARVTVNVDGRDFVAAVRRAARDVRGR